jgi:hypothetical protein
MRRFPLGPAVVLLLVLAPQMPSAADPVPSAAAVPAPQDELRQGRAAYAHGDYASAATHFARAAAGFQVTGDRESLAAAYLELGRVDLVGLGEPERALTAFLQSAERAARPADALLWAATAADKLGLAGEAERYRERALEPPRPAPEPAPKAPAAAPAPKAPAVAAPPAMAAPVAAKPAPAPALTGPVAPPAPPAPAKPAVAPAPSPPRAEGAFDHFFVERPAPEPPPAPEPIPARDDTAFDHFFGPRVPPAATEEETAAPPVAAEAPAPAAAPGAAAPPPAPASRRESARDRHRKARTEKEKGPAAAPAKPDGKGAPAAGGQPVGAFDYFFKKKRPAPATPPAGPPAAAPADPPGDGPAEKPPL